MTFIEAKVIAEDAENSSDLKRAIFDINDLENIIKESKIFPNSDKNLIMDLVSFGSASDFKLHIIEAYILELIYNEKIINKDKIVEKCEMNFKSGDNLIFYEKLLNRLLSSKKVLLNKKDYTLEESELKRIYGLKENFILKENEFLTEIEEILGLFNQTSFKEEYIEYLRTIYTDNFHSELFAFEKEIEEENISTIATAFLKFATEKLSNVEEATKLVLKLLNYCKSNKFIQKYSASIIFSKHTSLSDCQNYLDHKKKIFIDTQIAIHALCYFYNSQIEFENYYYNTTRSLIEFSKKNNVKLYLTDKYLSETQSHIKEALNLIPFTRLESFKSLGRSRNVLYNFYLRINEDENNFSFEEFMNKFKFKADDGYKTHLQYVETYLNELNIEKETISKNYDLEQSKKFIWNYLSISKKFKPIHATENDASMMEFLGDNDINIHQLTPVFITWDNTFFNIKKEYFLKNPKAQKWHLFRPGKFIDLFSLVQFSVESETLTNTIIAHISDEIIDSAHALIDSITTILNPNNEVGIEYTNKLADIKNNEIHKIQDKEIIPPDEIENETVIDDVLYKLIKYYNDKNKLDELKLLFQEKKYVTKVISLISDSCKEFYKTKKMNENIFTEFDNLICEIKTCI